MEEKRDFDPSAHRGAAPSGEGWGVVLYDNDEPEVKQVTAALMKFVGVSLDQAMSATMKAERDGSAIVTITTQAHAHKIAEGLKSADMEVELVHF